MANELEVKIPDIGDFTDVEVIDVLVSPGASVAVEDPLITLETDKAAMDVPAPAVGIVKSVAVSNGDKVSEGSIICVIEVSDDTGEKITQELAVESKSELKLETVAQAKLEHEPEPDEGVEPEQKIEPDAKPPPRPAAVPSAPTDEKSFAKAHASPSIRKFARELGVDLGQVKGSGLKERITQEDVKGFVKSVLRSGGTGGALPAVPVVDFAKFGEIEIQPINRVKKISGPRLHAAWVNVPHVTQHDDADITDLEVLRKSLKADAATIGAKLTPLAFLIKASVHALREFPEFNASLDPAGENLVLKKYFHVGFAVDTPNGLMVPVIKDADRKNVFDIGKELGELGGKAREGKLKVTDMQGGCFSISSLGSIGGGYFTPIVNAPEVAILGVSKSRMQPVWNGSEFQPRLMLPLSLSYDHRVVDGAAAARFTTFLATVLRECRNLVL